jgi:hypothetical protein
VVDFPVDDGPIAPRQASKRLAILLRLGILAFAGVLIITMFTSGGGIKIPEMECTDVVVGHTPNFLPLLGVGGSRPLYEPRYQIVIRDIPILLPPTLTKMFMKGSRCGQP